MNATVEAILARLPDKPLHFVQEIADAFGIQTPSSVVDDINSGLLDAVKFGSRYIVSDAEARRYITSKAVTKTEGTLTKK